MSDQERAELIPADLAPRITQMVVDDLRSAGWTVEPPIDHELAAYAQYVPQATSRPAPPPREPGFYRLAPMTTDAADYPPPSTVIRDRIRSPLGRKGSDWCRCDDPDIRHHVLAGLATCERCGGYAHRNRLASRDDGA